MLSTILSLRSLFVRNKLESARKFQHLAKKKHCRIHWEREWYFLEKGKLCNFRAENQHIGKPWGNLVTQERDRKGNEFNGPMNDTRVWIRKYTPYWTFVLSDSRLFVVRLDYVRAHAMIGLFIGTWAHCTGESKKEIVTCLWTVSRAKFLFHLWAEPSRNCFITNTESEVS